MVQTGDPTGTVYIILDSIDSQGNTCIFVCQIKAA